MIAMAKRKAAEIEVAITPPISFNESNWPRGFYTGGKGYKVELDDQVAHTGRQSLRSHFVGTQKAQANKVH